MDIKDFHILVCLMGLVLIAGFFFGRQSTPFFYHYYGIILVCQQRKTVTIAVGPFVLAIFLTLIETFYIFSKRFQRSTFTPYQVMAW